MLKLKRKKTGDRVYDLVDAKTGTKIATAAQTGEHGRDNYPWERGFYDSRIFGKLDMRTTQSHESLKDIVDFIESHINSFGLLKPSGDPVSGYEICKGQHFRYAGYYYQATADPTGEFNAYVQVLNYRGDPSEIVIRHGDFVTLYDWEYKPV